MLPGCKVSLTTETCMIDVSVVDLIVFKFREKGLYVAG